MISGGPAGGCVGASWKACGANQAHGRGEKRPEGDGRWGKGGRGEKRRRDGGAAGKGGKRKRRG